MSLPWQMYRLRPEIRNTGLPCLQLPMQRKIRELYKNEKLDQLEEQLSQEFDTDKRAKLAVQMQQTVLDDNAFVYCSFLKMSQISRANVTGYMAHACDYYQVTADLDIN